MTIISVHVMKTAGTSFKKVLSDIFDEDELYFDYGENLLKKKKRQFLVGLYYFLYGNRPLVEDPKKARQFKCIHGHFHTNKYDHIYKDIDYVTWLRDPVQQLLSYYFFTNNKAGGDPADREKIINFFKKPKNIQSKLISPEKNNIMNFKFVGITEEFDRGVELFCKIFNFDKKVAIPHCNATITKENKKYEAGEEILGLIKENNRLDFELYEQAKQRFETLCGEYGV